MSEGWGCRALDIHHGSCCGGISELKSQQWQASQEALVVNSPPASAGDVRDAGSVPGLGRSPGVGNGNPLQYSPSIVLGNPTDRGAWWATVHGATESDVTEHAQTLSSEKGGL